MMVVLENAGKKSKSKVLGPWPVLTTLIQSLLAIWGQRFPHHLGLLRPLVRRGLGRPLAQNFYAHLSGGVGVKGKGRLNSCVLPELEHGCQVGKVENKNRTSKK